jgi:hydrogenase small subunit
MKNIYWLHCGGCDGDSIALLNLEHPNLLDILKDLSVNILYHPSFSVINHREQKELLADIESGKTELDFLVVEGNILRGPASTGMFDLKFGVPKKNIAVTLAEKAKYIIAFGTCASYGGIGVGTETQATGMQFIKNEKGGLLGADFTTPGGYPVINLPGCPCHPEIFTGTLAVLIVGMKLELDEYNRPISWYGMMVHQGCTRNEYHEYRVEENDFGEKGCLFFHLGCHGPLAGGSCNKTLWSKRSSKPRVGVPCFGCSEPSFPQDTPFYQTENIEGIPIALPNGISRAHYMVYKGMAAAAAPLRLKRRETKI